MEIVQLRIQVFIRVIAWGKKLFLKPGAQGPNVGRHLLVQKKKTSEIRPMCMLVYRSVRLAGFCWMTMLENQQPSNS